MIMSSFGRHLLRYHKVHYRDFRFQRFRFCFQPIVKVMSELEPDGLPVRDSGEWVKRKHHFLGRYCHMFTEWMKHKWRGQLNYIDLMAGPGRCRITTSRELV